MDLVLTGFAAAGLDVTDNSGSLVESDIGAKNNSLTGANYQRAVRALVIAKDATATKVLLTGIEARDDNGRVFKRIRIDNRAGGNGEKVWCQLVAVAVFLDSTQVSPNARKADKCAERLKAK
jgi:hypothetical protein